MTAVDQFAGELRQLRAKVKTLERGENLGYSAFEHGAIEQYTLTPPSEEGGDYLAQVAATFGRQYDGTNGAVTLAGPPPPTPATLTIEARPGGVLVHWDGTWALSVFEVAPLGFTHLEVHVSTTDIPGILAETKRGEIVSARGGEVFVPVGPGVPVYCWGVARNNAGKASTPGPSAGPVAGGKVSADDLDIDLDDLRGTTIWYGPEDPEAPHVGDLWLKEPEHRAYRYSIDDLGNAEWVDQRDQGIIDALQAAADAATAANQAGIDALAAQGVAEQAQTNATAAGDLAATADQRATDARTAADSAAQAASSANDKALEAAGIAAGKGRVIHQASAPSTGTALDLWIDTDDNRPYRWNGNAWVVISDTGIQAAATAASNAATAAAAARGVADQAVSDASAANTLAGIAKTAADSKITVYRQSAAPSGGTYKVNGDLWIDSDDGLVYYASTTSGGWTATPDQRIALALTNAATADGKAVSAGSVAASKTTVFAQTSAPNTTGRTAGDLWFDTDDGNRQYVWLTSGATSWTEVVDALVTAASTLATQAKTAADSKITVYRQSAAPSGGTYKVNGDLWIDSDDGLIYYASTTTGGWTATPDQRIATALTNAATADGKAVSAGNVAATKTTVFAQTSAPSTTGRTVGDVWIDTDDANRWYDWIASAWTPRQWGAAAISATARQLGAITTYRQASAPAATGLLVGDFWIESATNKLYRWEGSTPSWVLVQDTGIQTAISNAATAQAVADGKMRIFPQTSAPTGLTADDVGDMWIDTDDSNKTYTWALVSGSTYGWVARLIGNAAIQPNSLVASDVVATGSISGALLKADAIDGKTITGALIRTAASGTRLILDSINGLRGIAVEGGNDVVKTQLGTDGILRATDAILSGTLSAGAGAAQGVRLTKTGGSLGGGAIELWPTDLSNVGGVGQPGILEALTEDGGLMVRFKAPPRSQDNRFSSITVRTADTSFGDGIILDSTANIRLNANGGTDNDLLITARNIVLSAVGGYPANTLLRTNNAGTTGVISGTAPPAGTPLLTKTFYATITLNSNGDGTVTFPGGAFPNGLLALAGGHISTGAPSNNLEIIFWGATRSTTNIRAYFGTGILGGVGLLATITAIGW